MKAVLLSLNLIGAFFITGLTCVAEEPLIASNAQATKPLKAGVEIPDVTIQDSDGEPVTLASLHKERPVVLVFFRGGWCPICTRHSAALMKSYPQVKALGAELVGISPDNTDYSNANITKNSISFPILSDADVTAAKAFGLAFQVDDETLERYKGFGIDLEKASGLQHHALPVPAVFIVDKSGKIVFAHSDPDYRNRLDASRIIIELKKLRGQ